MGYLKYKIQNYKPAQKWDASCVVLGEGLLHLRLWLLSPCFHPKIEKKIQSKVCCKKYLVISCNFLKFSNQPLEILNFCISWPSFNHLQTIWKMFLKRLWPFNNISYARASFLEHIWHLLTKQIIKQEVIST